MPWILAESVRDLNLGLPHLKRKTKYSKKKKKEKKRRWGVGRERVQNCDAWKVTLVWVYEERRDKWRGT